MDPSDRTIQLVEQLIVLGVVRATFSIEGQLTSFELGPAPVTLPAPAPEQEDLPAVPDDITTAANRLMGRP